MKDTTPIHSIVRNKKVYTSIDDLIIYFLGDAKVQGSYDKGAVVNSLIEYRDFILELNKKGV